MSRISGPFWPELPDLQYCKTVTQRGHLLDVYICRVGQDFYIRHGNHPSEYVIVPMARFLGPWPNLDYSEEMRAICQEEGLL